MRKARDIPKGSSFFCHVCNRTVGMPDELPFAHREKSRFLKLVRRLTRYYVIEVVSLVVMGNHYHIKLHVPSDPPSSKETCRRYSQHYNGRKKLDPDSDECTRISLMLNDLSCFMHDLQQQFTVWFNKTRDSKRQRRGPLWADRFKSVVHTKPAAVWRCLVYHVMNPVKAEIVRDPADYRFSCWGMWSKNGWHPFQNSVRRRLLPYLGETIGAKTMEEYHAAMVSAIRERIETMTTAP